MAMFLTYTIVLLIVQTALFISLPRFLQKIITWSILGGTIANFILSYYILMFVGQGNAIGCANLAASVLFTGVLYWKRNELYGKAKETNSGYIE